MIKEKILKLFQGTKEDMIIGCNIAATNYDIYEFLESICDGRYLNTTDSQGKKRPQYLFGEEPKNGLDKEDAFYYKIKPNEILCCVVGSRVTYCRTLYIPRVETINHF